MDRKHRATGKKPPGGARPGAGRPKGAKNTLGYGEVKAVKAAGLRVPETAPADHRELADEALDKLVQVMRGTVHYIDAPAQMKAAVRLREEICGPLEQKQVVSGPDGGPVVVEVREYTGDGEP